MATLTTPRVQKPYTPPKKGKAMTVAAGLVCSGGVILGADTQISYGLSGKRNESKVLPLNRELGCYATYTGDCDFASELFERIRETIKTVHANSVIALARHEFSRMVRAEADKPVEERAQLEFLITTRLPDEKAFNGFQTVLYRLTEQRTIPITKYATIGIGQELATAIFEHRYSQTSIPENAIMLVDAIRQVKRSVQFTGGSTNIVAVRNNDPYPGGENWGKIEIDQIERDCEFVESKLNPLLRAFPSGVNEEIFDSYIERFVADLREHRAKPGRIKPSILP